MIEVTGRQGAIPGWSTGSGHRTFAELRRRRRRWAHRTFLVQGERRISSRSSRAVRSARDALGPWASGTGDRVLLPGYNSPNATLAIWSLGAVPVLGNRGGECPEVAHRLATVAPRAVLTDAPHLIAATDLPVLHLSDITGCFGAEESGWLTSRAGWRRGPGRDLCSTSGSTGMPPAVSCPSGRWWPTSRTSWPAHGNSRSDPGLRALNW